MTLHDHFQALVTAEDEFETISQRLLAAAIKLGRAPNFCVYYDSSPQGITAAHNCTLKAVGVQVRGCCACCVECVVRGCCACCVWCGVRVFVVCVDCVDCVWTAWTVCVCGL
jgi:hypothetical protein